MHDDYAVSLTVTQLSSTSDEPFKKSVRLRLHRNCKGCDNNHKDVEFSINVNS